MAATAGVDLIARRVPGAVILVEAGILEAEVTARDVVCRAPFVVRQDVNKVKVRGEKGVLNGTPFLMWPHSCLASSTPCVSTNFANEKGLGCPLSTKYLESSG